MNEEEFPSLIKTTKKLCDDFGRDYYSLGEAPFHIIEKHCLDKAKVKEVIDEISARLEKIDISKIGEHSADMNTGALAVLKEVRRELGL